MRKIEWNTPERGVRPQIEKVKALLTAAGLGDAEDDAALQTQTFHGLHTIRVAVNGEPRTLRVSYQWLSDHPDEADLSARIAEVL